VGTKFIAIVLLVTTIAGIVVPLTTTPELQVLVNSWLSNEPKMLIKLLIELPVVSADSCLVIVRRFPTSYNPTRDGLTEEVYLGLHRPGTTVEVKNTLFAYVASYKLDEKTGKYLINYYEPQEYYIAIACVENNKTVFKWSRIVEVYPRSIIHTETIKVSEKENKLNMLEHVAAQGVEEVSSGVSSNPFVCDIQQTEYTEYPYVKRVGYCITWVRGPRIYSIDGLWVSFKIYVYPRPSTIYIEAFDDFDFKPYYYWLRPESQVQWKSAGKKLTPSEETWQTSYLTGNYSDRVYFKVEYVYEHRRGCATMGVCYAYWLLYPAKVADVARSAEEPSLPNEVMPYTPPPPPPYAREGRPGSGEIGFLHNQVVETDVVHASTTITVTLKGIFSVSLTFDFYRAGRDDNQYTTPTLPIYSTRYFWRWYLDNNPVTYEVLFAPRQV
jgi:hypothetical protein